MALEPVSYSTSHSRTAKVLIDKHDRISLSKATRDMLGIDGIPSYLYVFYDADLKRIGLAKPDIARMTDVKQHKFDTRGYASAKSIIAKYNLDNRESIVYEYDGKESLPGSGHAHVFRQVESAKE